MYRLQDGLEFLRSLPDQSVDGIFTDPPWGKGPAIQGQDIWKELIHEMTNEAARILKPTGKVLIWVGMRMFAETVRCIDALEYKWTFFCYYIPPRYLASFESSHDPILFYNLPGAKFPKTPTTIRSLYQSVSTGKSDTMHPCARHFSTVKHILRDWFEEGEYVIDPFAGSDTVGVACRELNLKYDTCEIDPQMYRFGVARNKQMGLFEENKE